MSRFGLVLVAIVLICMMAIGCSEDNPVAPPPTPGTVDVAASPDNPPCPWQLTGPSSYSHSGSGDETLADMTAGSYTLTWGAVAGWDLPDPPSQTQTLASGGKLTFTGTYTAVVAETVSPPDAPGGPATGVENQDLTYSFAGSVSNHGDDLEYRFDWGDGSFSDWETAPVQKSWSAEGTYEVKAQARCIAHPAIESVWSAATTVMISVYVAETVSGPDAPTGSATNQAGQNSSYSTSGAVSSYGDDLEYRFDWGDGIVSTWSASATASHSWSAEGAYQVKAQARCSDHQTVESVWSAATEVTITPATAETVSAPDAPGGPVVGETDESLAYTAGGAVSSLGDPVEYRFDFGDGTVTGWLNTVTVFSHDWNAAGTYEVTVQARCRDHDAIESAWSAATSVVISDPDEFLVNPPEDIFGVVAGAIDEPYDYQVFHGSLTNLGEPVEGRFDWGDGSFSDWLSTGPYTASHAWTAEGTYVVRYQARCSVHNDISVWSNSLEVTITTTAVETISKPGYVNYPYASRNPEIDIPVLYPAYGGTSSLGHPQEVMFDWGDGTQSAWVAELTEVSKTWTVAGTYQMTRQARCAEHPDVLSEWSDPVAINAVSEETVSTPNPPDGPTTGTWYENLYYTASGSSSNWHVDSWIYYRFDWGDGSALTEWSEETTLVHQYTALGDYEVKVQAQCAYPGHGEPESEWSLPTVVSIVEEITARFEPVGPAYGATGEAITFSIYSASSNVGHALEYQFDWDDGTFSDWSASETADHAYAAAGTYAVLYRARCAEHTNAVSDWSSDHTIEVTSDPEIVSTPDMPSRNSAFRPIVDVDQILSATGSFSNHGHPIEFQFDFGDGTLSEWTPGKLTNDTYVLSFYHTYTSPGIFEAFCRARCATHGTVVSADSEVLSFEIFENVDQPTAVTGPATGTTGANLTFSTTGSTSSEGHALEYSFEYKRGSYTIIHESDWSSSLTDDYVFTEAGTYGVRVRARCATHPDAVSYHSNPSHSVSITD